MGSYHAVGAKNLNRDRESLLARSSCTRATADSIFGYVRGTPNLQKWSLCGTKKADKKGYSSIDFENYQSMKGGCKRLKNGSKNHESCKKPTKLVERSRFQPSRIDSTWNPPKEGLPRRQRGGRGAWRRA